MRIDFSTLHSTGEYGPEQSDTGLVDGIYCCSLWPQYIVFPINSDKVMYWKSDNEYNTGLVLEPYSKCKAFPAGTVITFTQDSI